MYFSKQLKTNVFSGTTISQGYPLFIFSNICSKLTIEGPEVVLVSLLSTLIIFDTLLLLFFFFLYVVFFFADIERERRMEYFTALIYIYLCIPELDLGE